MKGIHRAAAQRGPAALSIQTSAASPYGDEATDADFLYAYRSGSPDQPDNRALRAAGELGVPIVYFIGTRPGWYRPLYPCYVTGDDSVARRVLVSPGAMQGALDDHDPGPIMDVLERRYAVREVKVRLHQARFRGVVLPAYRDRCSICRLREVRLLDAAHIVADLHAAGEPVVSNGLSLCTIHHRAFDENLVGVSPDYRVHLARRLVEEEDGPMLDVLKRFDGVPIEVPERRVHRPDRDRLALRFDQFSAAA
jgi:putative restriction endonuclease